MTEEDKPEFTKILPKLYYEKYDPCYNNFIVKEDDAIKGAVGLWYNNAVAGGINLRCGGIGNVAVARDSRSKGYMIDCMNMCVEDMINSNTDLGLLGGQRQRYGYFGFEAAGYHYKFCVNTSNVKHCLGKDAKSGIELIEVVQEDTETLEKIEGMFRNDPYYTLREEDKLVDIYRSWSNRPFAAFKDGIFKGFVCFDKDYKGLSFMKAVDKESIPLLILAAFEKTGSNSFDIRVAPFYKDALSFLDSFSESYHLETNENFAVYNYKNVVEAFLNIKAGIETLCDGEIKLHINGYRCCEKLLIRVKNNKPSVEYYSDGNSDMELAHHEATRLLFALSSEKRKELPPEIRQWFPLPLFSYSCDNV